MTYRANFVGDYYTGRLLIMEVLPLADATSLLPHACPPAVLSRPFVYWPVPTMSRIKSLSLSSSFAAFPVPERTANRSGRCFLACN